MVLINNNLYLKTCRKNSSQSYVRKTSTRSSAFTTNKSHYEPVPEISSNKNNVENQRKINKHSSATVRDSCKICPVDSEGNVSHRSRPSLAGTRATVAASTWRARASSWWHRPSPTWRTATHISKYVIRSQND